MYCLHSASVIHLATESSKLLATNDSLPAKKPRHLLTNNFSSFEISLDFHCLTSLDMLTSDGLQLLATDLRKISQTDLCL